MTCTDTPAPPLPLPPGRTIDLPGRGTTFIREHRGPQGAPTLLLLHGWTVTADLNWFSSYEALGEDFSIVTIDHRGHGRGIHSRDRFRLEDCADDAAAVIEALALDSVIAVGYSMGGPIAQLLWQRHPNLVAGLVLCATSATFQTRPDERMWFAGVDGLSRVARVAPMSVLSKVSQHVMTNKLKQGPLHDWAVAECSLSNPRILLEAGASLGRFHSDEWIGDIDVPASVVVTDNDRVVPRRRQERLAATMPGATVHHVAGDHSVCVADPEVFLPALLEACHEVSKATGTS
jgi:3-oxoadipate enol-lactonase